MAFDLIGALEAQGYTLEAQGGNCRALVRTESDGRVSVITSTDGDAPFADDWLVCVYASRSAWDNAADELARACSMDDGATSLDEARERLGIL